MLDENHDEFNRQTNTSLKRIIPFAPFFLAACISVAAGPTYGFQSDASTDNQPLPNDSAPAPRYTKPNMLSTHPLGLFSTRIHFDFSTRPPEGVEPFFHLSNGNVWLPYVKAYVPLDEAEVDRMRSFIWHEREDNFDVVNSPAQAATFVADGVFRAVHLGVNIPLGKRHWIGLQTRVFSLDRGKFPFSTWTSDGFIEWFHSNIIGKEDPFGRKQLGVNQGQLSYTDFHGNSLELSAGDVQFAGSTLSHHFILPFPKWEAKGFNTKISTLIGINTTPINPVTDAGLSLTVQKAIPVNRSQAHKSQSLHFGAAIGWLERSILDHGTGVEIISMPSLQSGELILRFQTRLRNNWWFSAATNYYLQSNYHKKEVFDYVVLTGGERVGAWNYAFSHLYRINTAHGLIVTFTRPSVSFSVYFREDLLVDNAPDLQTGMSITYSFKARH